MPIDDPPLVEPYGIADIHISGIAYIEDLGDGEIRMVCFTKRRNAHSQADEHVVVASLVMTKVTLTRNIFMAAPMVDLSVGGEVRNLPREENDLLN